jgi:hypothetical protein
MKPTLVRGVKGKPIVRRKRVSRIVRHQTAKKYRVKLLNYRRILTKPKVSEKTKTIMRRKIYRIRVIRGGRRYVNKVERRWKWFEDIAKKQPTPQNKARVLRW